MVILPPCYYSLYCMRADRERANDTVISFLLRSYLCVCLFLEFCSICASGIITAASNERMINVS